jgi:hypothetical protein
MTRREETNDLAEDKGTAGAAFDSGYIKPIAIYRMRCSLHYIQKEN